LLFIMAVAAQAQTASGTIRQFEEHCATCHRNAGVASAPAARQAPSLEALRKMTPEAVYAVMTMNPTTAHAQSDLTDALKRGFAEFVGGRKLGAVPAGDPKAMPNQCAAGSKLGDLSAMPTWNGWSVDTTNARFQSANAAGLTPAQVPN